MVTFRYLTAKELKNIIGVSSITTAQKEYRTIQDSLGLKRKLIYKDLETYFGYPIDMK